MSISFDEQDVLWGTAMRGFSWCFEVNSPFLRIDVESGEAEVVGYTGQIYNHGGDIDLRQVKVCHRADNARIVPLLIDHTSLGEHLAHGDVVPEYPCSCD